MSEALIPAPTIEGRVQQLIDLLTLRPDGDRRYVGSRQPGGQFRVFGGQVIAQGIMAAIQEVAPERPLHSLHAYFMRPGDEAQEITYQVERDFDGGSFSNRRIIALQSEKPILNMTASFHRVEQGLSHQDAMPNVPGPENLMSEFDALSKEIGEEKAEKLFWFQRIRPIETRPVERRDILNPKPQKSFAHVWVRLGAPIGDDMNLHRAILAYASDMMLLDTCILPHGISWRNGGLTSASLDHSVWFHDDFRVDDWLLYAMDSPWSGRARGFNRGRFYTRDGRLVASVTQEGLIRYDPSKEKAPV